MLFSLLLVINQLTNFLFILKIWISWILFFGNFFVFFYTTG